MSFKQKNGDSEVTGDFSRLEKLVENLGKKMFVDVGILGSTNKTVEGGATLALIMAVHEFGTDKAGRGNSTVIPSRSWLVMPLETGQKEIEKALEPKIQSLIEKGDIEGIFKLLGLACEARIQEAFETGGFGNWPELAESTIQQKGSAAILIHTGAGRQAVTSKVGG